MINLKGKAETSKFRSQAAPAVFSLGDFCTWSFLLNCLTATKNVMYKICLKLKLKARITGPLGLLGRKPARQTSKPGSNPIWDTTVHPACETFNVMRVV